MPPGPMPRGRLYDAARRVKLASARRVVGGGDRGLGRLLIPLLVIAVIAFAAVKARSAQTDARGAVAVASVAEDVAGQAGRLQLLELSHRTADRPVLSALSRGRGAIRADVSKLRRNPAAQEEVLSLQGAGASVDTALASLASSRRRQSVEERRALRAALAHLARSAAARPRRPFRGRGRRRTPTLDGSRCGRSGSGSGWRPC